MSAQDRLEADRLSKRLNELMQKRMTINAQLAAVLKKYQGTGTSDKIAQDWIDIGIISAVVIAKSPTMRSYVYNKSKDIAKDQAKDQAKEFAIKKIVDDDKISDTILKILDIVSAETPLGAAYHAFDPFQSLGKGDDRPNEITYLEQKLDNYEQEFSSAFMFFMLIINRYDRDYLIRSTEILGPQLRAAP